MLEFSWLLAVEGPRRIFVSISVLLMPSISMITTSFFISKQTNKAFFG